MGNLSKLKKEDAMTKVGIQKTSGNYKNDLHKLIKLIGGIENFIGIEDVVMIKPNINGLEAITNIGLVAALIEILIDFGVKKVFVAESSFGDEKMTQMYFKKSGYAKMCEGYGIDLVNLNASEIAKTKVHNPLANNTLDIAKEVFEADKIINVPVMKVHYATGVSLAMKNLKGVLVKEQKRKFHDIGLDESIVDLNSVVKPALNIIDATTCMERMGPHGGDAVNMNLLIAGENIAAVDYVGCEIMGYTLDEVGHLRHFIQKSGFDTESIEIVGENVEAVSRRFVKVDVSNIIPEKYTVNENDACCTCMNALLLSLRFLEEEHKAMDAEICMGSNINEIKDDGRVIVAFGNCRRNQEGCDITIKGCPPYPFHLKSALDEFCKNNNNL